LKGNLTQGKRGGKNDRRKVNKGVSGDLQGKTNSLNVQRIGKSKWGGKKGVKCFRQY